MTFFITILGNVQGVGYRPFVARLAKETGITGTVQNSGGVVRIQACGTESSLNQFIQELVQQQPPKASVTEILTDPSPVELEFLRFQIIESSEDAEFTPFLPPDLPLCDACRRELSDPDNRRFRHPFISCVDCGPRYSIMKTIPYDRKTSTMHDYKMCAACEEEYSGDNRRCHAQTLSCNDCGPQLILKTSRGELHKEEALMRGVDILREGGILAIKGIGGYQFACRPDRSETVISLRNLKNRGRKPFAVMFPDMQSVKNICHVSPAEEDLLLHEARPIVILHSRTEEFCAELRGGNRRVGAFLPYTALHQLLTDACGPLIMTSANLSDEPILYRDEDMLKISSPLLSGVLYHTRKIVTPLDDSVARVISGRTQLIRRSRGFVPNPISLSGNSAKTILAMGSDLKSCFCLYKKDRAYLSQYFGDMDNYAVKQNFKENIVRMQRLFHLSPDILACDMHPKYMTARMAEACVKNTDRKRMPIQHHHAHAASVMAEHALPSCIGVTFDGTGYGTDGAVWGGEFLLCKDDTFERAAHLQYVTMCGGDEALKHADRTAYCFLQAVGVEMPCKESEILRPVLSDETLTWKTSSMGRLFDAVSAVLGICTFNSYEGECAVMLENAADEAVAEGIAPFALHFAIRNDLEGSTADAAMLLSDIYRAVGSGIDIRALALGFHKAIAEMVVTMCSNIRDTEKENRVALSGGVFANELLMQDCIDGLENAGFEVYINENVPTNDGGICLGQAWICGQKAK